MQIVRRGYEAYERGDLPAVVIAFLLVAPAVFVSGHGLPRRVLANPLVAWIGLISYGIFLWHFAVAREVGADLSFGVALMVMLAFSVTIAAASCYLVERPILRFKYRPIGDMLGPLRRGPQEESRP